MPQSQGHIVYLKCLKPQPHPERPDLVVISMDLPMAMVRDAIDSLQHLNISHHLMNIGGRTALCISRNEYDDAVIEKS